MGKPARRDGRLLHRWNGPRNKGLRMSGAGLKFLVFLPVLLLFGGLIWAVARRNAAERKDKEGKD